MYQIIGDQLELSRVEHQYLWPIQEKVNMIRKNEICEEQKATDSFTNEIPSEFEKYELLKKNWISWLLHLPFAGRSSPYVALVVMKIKSTLTNIGGSDRYIWDQRVQIIVQIVTFFSLSSFFEAIDSSVRVVLLFQAVGGDG